MSNTTHTHNDFGTIEFIVEVYKNIVVFVEPTPFDDVNNYLRTKSKSAYAPGSLEGIFELFSYLDIITIENDKLYLNSDNYQEIENTETAVQDSIVYRIFHRLLLDDEISQVFQPQMFKYDETKDCFHIESSLIPFKYSWLRNALITLDFFKPSIKSSTLLINNQYYPFFSNNVLGQVKEFNPLQTRNGPITFQEFIAIQSQKEIYGKQAEEFALNYERNRLSYHPNLEKVKIISNLDVGAGYDIISYMSLDSDNLDRFIEVKSYSGTCHFFWSRNEIEKARLNNRSYFLYLVDRSDVEKVNYAPLIVCNPYQEIFKGQHWLTEPESWSVSRIPF
jgi:hypothetical protein